MCAVEAGRRGRRVLVLEHADGPGKKILISGGGRCNFTNRNAAAENFLCSNPYFAKSALARFSARDFIALVERHGIAFHEKTLGQLFCDRSAHEILNLLLGECGEAGVRIQVGTRVLSAVQASATRISSGPSARFRVETSAGTVAAASLVVATGGLSIPKIGATSLGYDLAKQFGHTIVQTRPGLVPLVFSPPDQSDWCDLAGVSAEVVASLAVQKDRKKKIAQTVFREKMLLTHRGLSGPAVLQISSYWEPGDAIQLDLAPELAQPRGTSVAAADGEKARSVFTPLTHPNVRRDSAAAAHALRSVLPARMAERWLALHTPAVSRNGNAKLDALANATLAAMERELHAWRFTPAGTEGYAKAEVTVGGVDTGLLDARTMQSRAVPGLYFIGEVVDVTGWLGGYNFQWAWASGFSAGQSA